MSMFKDNSKEKCNLKMAILGPAKSGKSYSALKIASQFSDKIAIFDTENNSCLKYKREFKFMSVAIAPPFTPDKYIQGIQDAVDNGFDFLIIDSLSMVWNGEGGILEIVEKASARFKGNTYAGWSEGTPLQNKLMQTIINAPINIICTMRTKQQYVLTERNGRQVPQKMGMGIVQRDSTDYEFDVCMEMDMDNNGVVTGRFGDDLKLQNKVFSKPGKELADLLKEVIDGDPVELATKDQLEKLDLLFQLTGTSQERIEKWLKAAYVTCFPYMKKSQIQKCIDKLQIELDEKDNVLDINKAA